MPFFPCHLTVLIWGPNIFHYLNNQLQLLWSVLSPAVCVNHTTPPSPKSTISDPLHFPEMSPLFHHFHSFVTLPIHFNRCYKYILTEKLWITLIFVSIHVFVAHTAALTFESKQWSLKLCCFFISVRKSRWFIQINVCMNVCILIVLHWAKEFTLLFNSHVKDQIKLTSKKILLILCTKHEVKLLLKCLFEK